MQVSHCSNRCGKLVLEHNQLVRVTQPVFLRAFGLCNTSNLSGQELDEFCPMSGVTEQEDRLQLLDAG